MKYPSLIPIPLIRAVLLDQKNSIQIKKLRITKEYEINSNEATTYFHHPCFTDYSVKAHLLSDVLTNNSMQKK